MNPHCSIYTMLESPLGQLLLAGDENGLGVVQMPGQRHARIDPAELVRADEPFVEARRQLGEYFAGDRRDFDLPLNPVGTRFQLDVWKALIEIPFGQTASYGQLAQRISKPSAVRAVGAANGRNPLAIVVPCHRVVGANGTLTGYAGGLERKSFLLDHERGPEVPANPLRRLHHPHQLRAGPLTPHDLV